MFLGLTGLQSGLTRDVFAAVRRLVAAALWILRTGQSFLADVFFFLLLFFFLNWEAGSFPFLAGPKHLELPTTSTRWQHKAQPKVFGQRAGC